MATIVFCEDDPTIRKLVRATLRPTGHDVHVAADGREGLALIQRLRPDLVVTDVAMPNLDGLRLTDELKRRPELAHIPIVLLTASVQRSQVEEGYRHGVAGHLAKPFGALELRNLIGELIGA